MTRTAWASCLFLMTSIVAHAGEARQPAYIGPVGPEPEGRGCYWYRQRQFCARYCYVEVDGYRYCTEHRRDAYPQAPFWDADFNRDLPQRAPMMLGGPSFR